MKLKKSLGGRIAHQQLTLSRKIFNSLNLVQVQVITIEDRDFIGISVTIDININFLIGDCKQWYIVNCRQWLRQFRDQDQFSYPYAFNLSGALLLSHVLDWLIAIGDVTLQLVRGRVETVTQGLSLDRVQCNRVNS